MRIGELERRTGLNRHTIRYYETEGLLPAPRRLTNNYREYPMSAVEDLLFIRTLKTMEFTLPEIRGVMEAIRSGEMGCARGAALLRDKRRVVESRLRSMESLLERLRAEEGRLRASAESLGKTVPEEP